MDSNQPTSTPPTPPSAEPQIAAPMATPQLPHQSEKLLSAPPRTSWGALIGIIIILAVLIVSALYFWGAKLTERDTLLKNPGTETDVETRH